MMNEGRFQRLKKLRPYTDPNGNMFMIVDESDYNWLIEHVDELEGGGQFFEQGYRQLEDQNQRYKQALEWIKECSTDYQSRNKAMDALAGESD